MSSKAQMVVLNIMGKEYRIACEPHESATLIKSAQELNEQMCKMRDSGKVAGPERIAVMAALNLSHELQALKNNPIPLNSQSLKDCVGSMIAKIENILEKH